MANTGHYNRRLFGSLQILLRGDLTRGFAPSNLECLHPRDETAERSPAACFSNLGIMKVIVADKISERGVKLLKETGWKIVQTTKGVLVAELAIADALIL